MNAEDRLGKSWSTKAFPSNTTDMANGPLAIHQNAWKAYLLLVRGFATNPNAAKHPEDMKNISAWQEIQQYSTMKRIYTGF